MCETTAAFTGHRPQHLGLGDDERAEPVQKIKTRLHSAIERAASAGYTHFISGMGLGVDIWAAEAVLTLKEKFPYIALECAVPCAQQTERWSTGQKDRYARIIDAADKVTVLSQTYYDGCMQVRNRYMVDSSSLLIAVYRGSPGGGTAQTVHYALSRGVRIENVI